MRDAIAFEVSMQSYGPEIFRYLWRMTGDRHEAEDCLQETFLKAYQAFGRLKEDSNVRAWLYTIASNTAKSQLKKRGKQDWQASSLLEGLASRQLPVESGMIHKSELEAIHRAVQELPLKQKSALMMRKYQEMEYAEIGEILKCSPESARANVYQALRKLRKTFAE